MICAACPVTEELRGFLDDRLAPSRFADVATHVDACSTCQSALDELTRGQAYGLSVLSREFLVESSGPSGNEPRASSGDIESTDLTGDRQAATVTQVPGPDATTDLELGYDAQPGPAQPTASGWPRIPGYEILDVIREGGMGVVYRARQRGLNRLVALKMIRGGGQARPDHFARFRIEAEAVARLRHPNIVHIYEIDEADGLPFLSLELLEGGTLDDRLQGNPQPGKAAAELLIILARAVQVAHDAGIIHRDLKPSNVLFAEDGVPKITDFGLAKRLESDSRQTETGQIMGTPCYMAPEQARGQTRDVGPAADVYALGAMLYEMLTGRPPFKGETPIETLRQVVEDDVVPPSRLVPRVARDLETICLHCLKKDPARRYGSARELALDLENHLAGRPIGARRTPHWERALKLARRHPVTATLFVFGLIAAAGLGGAWLRYTRIRQVEMIQESKRLEERRRTVFDSFLGQQKVLDRGEWSEAERALTELLTDIRNKPGLENETHRAREMLAQAERGRMQEDTGRQDQARLGTFRVHRRETLFRETQFPGLGLADDRHAVPKSAEAALGVFAARDTGGIWRVGPLPESLSARDYDEIKEGCHELLLILAQSSEPDRGLRLLDEAAKLGPMTRADHLRRAECLDRGGDAAAAERERRAAEAMPLTSAIDHFLMGKELFNRADWGAAIPHLNAALLRRPDHFWSHCLAAACHLELHRPVAARFELTACLQSEPDLAWLHELRGFASYQIAALARSAATNPSAEGPLATEVQLQLQAAEDDYARALKLLGEEPNTDLRYSLMVYRGLLWLERREWDKAIADLQAAIHIDDRRWRAFETLAQVYHRKGEPDRAFEQFTRAIALRPEWSQLYRARAAVILGRTDVTQEHRASALADLDRTIRLEPPGSRVLARDHTSRARLLHQDGHEDEALAACDSALAIDPGHLDAHRLRIEVLRRLKRFEDVIASCDALLSRGQPSGELYEFRGLAHEKLGRYENAIEDQTLAIALRPGTASVLARRGVLYLVTDAPRSARRDFEKAIHLDPSNADAYLGRGLALAALGRHREAAIDATKALGMAEPTATRLYNAARIHAQAADAAASEARKRGSDAVGLVGRYQDEAMALLGRWQRQLPPAERGRALRDLHRDPAMASLRRRLRALDPAGQVTLSTPSAHQPRP